MEAEHKTEAAGETQSGLREPSLYAVVLHNDEVTTMDFVVSVLVKIFNKQPAEASNIMMDVHENGKGVAGVYTYDIAVTKKSQADRLSAEKGYPLQLSVKEAAL
ncbi:MAG: ATP-dependent Clp protease adaptor ClpS [Defluviitaleaceae bacterium]|nr:ATP-dependent Clp protease adaptor ClpS [Defluviitaleaceae bacterium]